ncbi:hypothetical protein BDD43_3857 [Mucilaginibacter gracilis]|uniref:Uncharacterized protein n=1 Tax=Mucilaginibacter gracilis TaxID=423350 RepID=A0A495J3T3_9SPHI|nr:hypothetical protein [Mucilaginibacter gracilis]RKR83645.1 hypothetical protein BDD43_3857 [Mucilaginibacter gracilis]
MPLSYIVDTGGNRTAVIIPIADWSLIAAKYEDLKLLEKPEAVEGIKPSDFFGTLSKMWPAICNMMSNS